MTSLREIVSNMVAGDDWWTVEAPPAWSQGRTLYGGMTAALCFEAARRVAPGMPVRSVHVLFAGPASGTLTLAPRLLRAGRSSAAVSVNCSGEAGEAALATFAFGSDRESRVDHGGAPRALPTAPPEDCPVFIERTGGFHERFELRLAHGSALMSGGAPEFRCGCGFASRRMSIRRRHCWRWRMRCRRRRWRASRNGHRSAPSPGLSIF